MIIISKPDKMEACDSYPCSYSADTKIIFEGVNKEVNLCKYCLEDFYDMISDEIANLDT